MTDRRYDLHDKIAEKESDWKTVAKEFFWDDSQPEHVWTQRMAEEIARLREILQTVSDELLDAANCIQVMKDGNDDDNSAWDRLRSLRHSFFGQKGVGLKLKQALALPRPGGEEK